MIISDWLDEGARRCILVELDVNISGVESTLYVSTTGYASYPTDTPANKLYPADIEGGIALTESVSLEGSISVSYGDITINNPNGIYDDWFTYIFSNRSVRIYIGDPIWSKSTFELIFLGTIAKISSSALNKINIQILDKLQQLNAPLSETVVGGTGTNADALLPTLFGECCNVTPFSYNPAILQYKIHTRSIERIIEVRDNGAPVTGYTANLSDGTFTLSTSPYGVITVSAQGDAAGGYTNTIASIIKKIVKEFGKASTRFTDLDINLSNFSLFDSLHPQPIGIYIPDKTNVLDIITNLAYSIGAFCFINRLGKLTLVQLTLPGSGTPTLIEPSNMLNGTFAIASIVPITAAVKLGYCKNWTVQDKLETGIPEEHKELFSKEYLVSSVTAGSVAAAHKLSLEPTQQDTFLLTTFDAAAEASRKLTLLATQRTIYSFDSFGSALLWELGQAVTLKYPRFNLELGKAGVITKLQKDFVTGKVKAEVLV
jgi:hypothetical protein